MYGRRFKMYKLRTMVKDAHEMRDELMHLNEVDGPVFKIRNDPRLHPLGGFLRRSSIDELPNFLNVIHRRHVAGRPAPGAAVRSGALRRVRAAPALWCRRHHVPVADQRPQRSQLRRVDAARQRVRRLRGRRSAISRSSRRPFPPCCGRTARIKQHLRVVQPVRRASAVFRSRVRRCSSWPRPSCRRCSASCARS